MYAMKIKAIGLLLIWILRPQRTRERKEKEKKKTGVSAFNSALNNSQMNIKYWSMPTHFVASGECKGFMNAP